MTGMQHSSESPLTGMVPAALPVMRGVTGKTAMGPCPGGESESTAEVSCKDQKRSKMKEEKQ